jgi:hypothetical protein
VELGVRVRGAVSLYGGDLAETTAMALYAMHKRKHDQRRKVRYIFLLFICVSLCRSSLPPPSPPFPFTFLSPLQYSRVKVTVKIIPEHILPSRASDAILSVS